jgi:hypothetical protein
MIWEVSSACWISDIQTVQTMDIGPKKSVCVVSSVLGNGLHINTLISRCRKTWTGDSWHAWRGGMAGKPWPVLDFNGKFLCRNARDGHFRQWLQPGGRGLMHALLPPSPLTDCSSFAQITRKNRWLGLRTRPHSPRASPPPMRQISIKRQKYWGGPLVFPTHVCDSAHPLVI